MKTRKNIKLPINDQEKAVLRKNKIKIGDLVNYAVDELEVLLGSTAARAKEIYALAQFQTIPSIGIRFAEDLVFLGFYTLDALKNQSGAKLTDAYELKKGFRVDPCVEDQFRLVVHVANTNDTGKTWWDFTAERKKYRMENGYPASRPVIGGHEIVHAG